MELGLTSYYDWLSGGLLPGHEPHDDVDVAHHHAVGRLRQTVHADIAARDVHQRPTILEEEVVVIGCVRIEVRLAAVNSELAQQASSRKLMQGVVDGRERHLLPRGKRLRVQKLSRDVPIAIAEQQRSERQSLPRRPEASRTQPPGDLARRRKHFARVTVGLGNTRLANIGQPALVVFWDHPAHAALLRLPCVLPGSLAGHADV